MFNATVALIVYVVQVVSLLVWSIGALQLLWQQRTLQHAEWHRKAAHLFVGYCVCEFFRTIDNLYPDFETGVVFSAWGVFPWFVPIFAWVLRDVLMFRGICVYMEHALIWSHTCMGWPVPRAMLRMQQVLCYFGNIVFFIAGVIYMTKNNQFWQPVAAIGQVPPNIAVAIVCYYLYRCLQKVPDCEESRHAIVVNLSLLVAAFSCIVVFVPWAVPKMLELYPQQLTVHPTIPAGSPVFFASPPSFFGAGDRNFDLSVAFVELTVGWCGYVGLCLMRTLQAPPPGEPLVLSSEEIGRIVAKTGVKKNF